MSHKESTLVVFCISYPFSHEESNFLGIEINYLKEKFDKIILVPNLKTEKYQYPIPGNTSVIDTLAYGYKKSPWVLIRSLCWCLLSPIFYKEYFKNFRKVSRFSVFSQLVGNLYYALRIKKLIVAQIKAGQIDVANTVFYSYVFNKFLLGLIFTKNIYKEMKIATRGLGSDIYEELYPGNYVPFRKYMTRHNVDSIALVSSYMVRYLVGKYPLLEPYTKVARMGTLDPEFVAKSSGPGCLSILSCSYVVPVKRLDLLIDGIEYLYNKNTGVSIKWTHVGVGPDFDEIVQLANTKLNNKIELNFTGWVAYSAIFDYYKQNPIDCIINVSKSEGIPVSVMEAYSAGIPAVATHVGGTHEIVTEETGILIPANPTPEEIAGALLLIYSMKSDGSLEARRLLCRKLWDDQYNAAKNYKRQTDDLFNLLHQ